MTRTAAGPEQYTTYGISAPLATHWRPATCAQVGCLNYENGWRIRVEGLSAELLHAAKTSGRKFIEQRVAADQTWLVFEAGQPCFQAAQHKLAVGKPELYIVRGGDWRGNPRGIPARLHQRPEDWVEDLHEHTDKLANARKEG